MEIINWHGLKLTTQQDEDGYIVSDEVFFMYGEGSTAEEALKDYEESISDYREMLEEEDNPSVHLKAQRDLLRFYEVPLPL
jgi:hypothetical protein